MSASNLGRVYGQSLSNNLVRDGIDLKIDGNLVVFDVTNRRVGINNLSPTVELDVTGNANVSGNLSVDNINANTIAVTNSGNIGNANVVSANSFTSTAGTVNFSNSAEINLGDPANVRIDGSNPDYVLTSDGNNNISWQNLGTLSANVGLLGNAITLGSPVDSSLVTNAAYREWTTGTFVTDAIDDLNTVVLNVYNNTFVNSVDFTANIVSGNSPLTVAFTSSKVGNPNTYLWDFGSANITYISGNVATANTTVRFTEADGGLFSVGLTASNSGGVSPGNSSSVSKVDYIAIATPTPVPSFTLDKTSLDSGTSVSLTNTSLYATDYVIHWGDGNSDTIASNSVAGGAGAAAKSHTYTNGSGDSRYTITLDAHSSTNSQTITSAGQIVKVYSTHTPLFSANATAGNNGVTVTFTNNTITAPGSTANFGVGNYYQWIWGDGTTTSVNVGSGIAGDTGQTITHTYALSTETVQQSYNAQLKVYNSHSTSPFSSATTAITVYPAPTARFTGSAVTTSDRTGDTAQSGYIFIDYLGNDRSVFTFEDTSVNADVFKFTWGDSTDTGNLASADPGGPTGGNITHSYSATGSKTVSLLAYSTTRSINAADNTLTRTSYITINSVPSAPAALSTKTLAISGGTAALITANATDNTSANVPAGGNSVTRFTTADPISTSTLSDVYNGLEGTLTAYVNGAASGNVTFSTANAAGTYTSLVVANSRDTHAVSASTYPSNFYRVFSASVSKANSAVSYGYNDYKLSHSISGNSTVTGFVKDSVTLAPTLDISTATVSENTAGTQRYVSGIPYYNTSGVVQLEGVKAYNWIGQCYLNSSSPLVVAASTVVEGTGNVISASQNKTYSNLDGATTYLSGSIPKANTGNTSSNSYTLGNILVDVTGAVNSAGKVAATLQNLNGTSTSVIFPTIIQVQNSLTGISETAIPVSSSLGSGFTDNGVRIYTGLSGSTPVFSGTTNYYTGNAWGTGSRVVAGTAEAIVRYGTLQHFQTNLSSGYLPVGPDLSTGRGATQYFRVAFRRTVMSNFVVTYSGKISGLWIAAPGTAIDAASSLNGWLDATTQYAGAGVPGVNTGAGGNGSDGCAFDASNKVITGSTQTNKACKLTLGSENASNAYGNNILITIALAAGDSLTSLSIGP